MDNGAFNLRGRAHIPIAATNLTDAERRRLMRWPDYGSTFERPDQGDAVARSLCRKGIGVMMPWKSGRQMGLTGTLGVPLHLYLKDKSDD